MLTDIPRVLFKQLKQVIFNKSSVIITWSNVITYVFKIELLFMDFFINVSEVLVNNTLILNIKIMGGVLNYILALIYMHSWVGIVEFHASKWRFQVFSMWICLLFNYLISVDVLFFRYLCALVKILRIEAKSTCFNK